MMELAQTIVSLAILGIMGIVILILDQIWTPNRRGFFENDQNLAYPYHGSTVPSHYLHVVGVIIPFFLILLHHFLNGQKGVSPRWKKNFAILALPTLIGYLFGAGATQVITDVGKYSVGRLRPHFFDVCKPVYDKTADTNGPDFPNYITNYTCTGNPDLFPDPEDLENRMREVSLSFPSGHSSFVWQAATFTILYLQAKFNKIPWARKSLLVPFFQVFVLAAAFFTAISRIMDNKHHPTDVIAGSLIGIICQILNVFGVTSIFSEDSVPVSEKTSEESFALRQGTGNENQRTVD